VFLPCYFLLLGSFKSSAEFFGHPFGLPATFGFSNYVQAWRQADLTTAARNSLIVTVSAVLLGTAAACAISYSIAWLGFRRSGLVELAIVSALFIPIQIIILAVYLEMRDLGLLGTLWPLILLYAALSLPLGIVLLVGFFRTLPHELGESAALDGAGPWRQFVDIALPLARLPLMTVAVLNGVWIWNDFYVPLIFSSNTSINTVPIAILNFFGGYTTEYGLVFACVVISAIPVVVVYVLMSRRFIEGITAGSVKG
jgi:raffinose/stachyose/melibiose transport system permease protein